MTELKEETLTSHDMLLPRPPHLSDLSVFIWNYSKAWESTTKKLI
jgi:hypothetical protein